MSDILNHKIAAVMDGPRLEIVSSLSELELRDSLTFHLEQLMRLTSALDILFPDRPRAGGASIQAAIDKLITSFRGKNGSTLSFTVPAARCPRWRAEKPKQSPLIDNEDPRPRDAR